MKKKDSWFGRLTAWLMVVCLICQMAPAAAIAEAIEVIETSTITEVETPSKVDSPALTVQDGSSGESFDMVTDTLTRDVIGMEGTSYSDWSYLSSESMISYVGNSGGKYNSIQLRSDHSNAFSGIVTTTSAGMAQSIVVDWNANTTSGRTLNVYGKDTEYESPMDLYSDDTCGTLIGTIVYGETTAFTIPSGYSYIGLRSASGAMYLNSISITWANEDPTAIQYAVNVNPSEHGIVTASRQTAPEGAQVALIVDAQDGYMLDMLTVTDDNDIELVVTNNAFYMPDCDVTVDATFVRLPPVAYLDERGDMQDTGDDYYHVLTSDSVTASNNTLTAGWWVVTEDAKISPCLTVEGDVRLILEDGVTLNAYQGIRVTGNNNLTIYGQTEGTGTLVAKGGTNAAGIGGKGGESGGTITINGGTVTATGSKGSGIYQYSAGGAGIGGGNSGSGGTITINGGTVTATGDACSAGIGGGSYGEGGTITINGGSVNATGGGYQTSPESAGGAGIGGGTEKRGGVVCITGGQITAQGSTGAAGIGPGGDCRSEDDNYGAITLSLSKDTDFVTANTYMNSHGKSSSITVAYPDGSEAFVRDADDKTATYSGTLSNDDIAAIAGKKLVTAMLPTLMSASLTLSGTIGVNYFMNLSGLKVDDLDSTYMEFTVGSGAKQVTHIAHFDPLSKDTKGACFGFTCPTTSIQMADPIEATFHYQSGDEDKELTLEEYSVKAYVEAFDRYQAEHATDGKAHDAKTAALVHSIADYGHYAQPYLAEANKWTIGSDYAGMDLYYTETYEGDDITAALADYAPTKDIDGIAIRSTTMSLKLESGTTVEATIAPQEGTSFTDNDVAAVEATFADGKEPEITLQRDGRISVRVNGVSAHQLGTQLKVTYDGKQVLSLSALSYAKAVLDGSDVGQSAKNAMCALYAYFDATTSYIAG